MRHLFCPVSNRIHSQADVAAWRRFIDTVRCTVSNPVYLHLIYSPPFTLLHGRPGASPVFSHPDQSFIFGWPDKAVSPVLPEMLDLPMMERFAVIVS